MLVFLPYYNVFSNATIICSLRMIDTSFVVQGKSRMTQRSSIASPNSSDHTWMSWIDTQLNSIEALSLPRSSFSILLNLGFDQYIFLGGYVLVPKKFAFLFHRIYNALQHAQDCVNTSKLSSTKYKYLVICITDRGYGRTNQRIT